MLMSPPTRETEMSPVEGLTADVRARVEANIGLVHHIAARVRSRLPRHHDTDDLVQAGSMGLIDAARRFDPDRGVAFSTFAGRRIEGAIADQLRRDDWAPRSVRRAERQLQELDARAPGDRGSDSPEISDQRALVARASLASLEESRIDAISDTPEPGDRLDRLDDVRSVRAALGTLRPKERFVIEAHFLDGRSITEIGEALGVTQSRASQIKADAMRSLRATLRTT